MVGVVRELTLADLDEASEIVSHSGDNAFSRKDLERLIKQNGTICHAACDSDTGVVGGITIWKRRSRELNLVLLVTTTRLGRETVHGMLTALLASGMVEARHLKKQWLVMTVHESMVPLHLFLRDIGFRARAVHRNYYDTGDGYEFAISVARLELIPVGEDS